MKKTVSLFIIILLLLSSCVIPEKFTCDINIMDNGVYSIDYKGTLLFWMALEEISKQGSVSKETDSQIKTFFDDWTKQETSVKKYQYQNNGRAYVEYFNKITDGSSLDLSDSFGLPLIITVQKDGSIIIRESAINNNEISEFVELGYKLDGFLSINSEIPIKDSGGYEVKTQGKKMS